MGAQHPGTSSVAHEKEKYKRNDKNSSFSHVDFLRST